MSRTRILIILAGLAAILVTSGAVYVFMELDRTNASLQAAETTMEDTTATLRETRSALAESNRDRVALADAAERLQQDKAGLQRDKSSLQADMNALTGYLNSELAKNGALTDDLEAAGVAHVQLRGEWVEAAVANHDPVGREGRRGMAARGNDAAFRGAGRRVHYAAHAASAVDAGSRRRRRAHSPCHRPPQRDCHAGGASPAALPGHAAATRRGVPLHGKHGTQAHLPGHGHVDARLLAGRDSRRNRHQLRQPSLLERRGWRQVSAPGRRYTHVIDDVHYYWPKGDAHAHADGCWVPHTAVDGYLIELHRNTVTANAELRDNVNAANVAYASAWEAYLDAIQAYCGHRNPQRCSVSTSNALGRQAQTLWGHVQEASALYTCWYNNAAASQYPGHIPYTC